jgi:hypothetical protein
MAKIGNQHDFIPEIGTKYATDTASHSNRTIIF